MDHPWYSTVVWAFRAIVGLDFLLAGLYFAEIIEPNRIGPWLFVSTIVILLSTILFAISMMKDRTARNDFMLGLFWLILVACTMFGFLDRWHELESHGLRIMRQR